MPADPARNWRRAVSIGECMVEIAPRSDGGYAMGFAGDTFNTAWYLRRLSGPDLDVAYLTAVGTDALSDRMLAFMDDAGVGTSHVSRRSDATVGLYLVTLAGAERSFTYWRETSAARHLAEGLDALQGAGADTLVYLSGITLAILSDGDRRTLLGALEAARAAGATIAFDPNIRPRLWDRPDAMRRWVEATAMCSDLVFPSSDDEAAAFGDASPQATAERYLEFGAACVAVKDGPRPVRVRSAGGEPVEVMPEPVAPVDTTAAGDSFNAGFLSALRQGATPEAAARLGCGIAAQVVQGRGALVEVREGQLIR